MVVADMLLIVVAGAFVISTVVLIAKGCPPEAACSALCVRYCCRAVPGKRP